MFKKFFSKKSDPKKEAADFLAGKGTKDSANKNNEENQNDSSKENNAVSEKQEANNENSDANSKDAA